MGQFKALTHKNWTLYKRSCCANIIEILVPIIFCLLMLLIIGLIDKDDFKEQAFLSNSTYTKEIIGNPSVAVLASGLAISIRLSVLLMLLISCLCSSRQSADLYNFFNSC